MKEQLEIYKIILKGNDGDTFGRYITDKYGRAKSNNPVDVFQKTFKSFISEIDKKVWKSKSNLMGLTILKQRGQHTKQIITPYSGTFVIDGYIDGGHYDMLRKLTKLSDTSVTTDITRDNMVTDRFYVYIQIKPSENVGILMVERKGQLSISATLGKFIEQFLYITNSRKCKVIRYIPPYLIDEFKNGAIVDSITCSDQLVKQVYGPDNLVTRDAHYDVTIKIKPRDDEDRTGDKQHLLGQLKSMFFSITGLDGDFKEMTDFTKLQGSLKQANGKTLPFELDDEDAIRPVITLEEELLSENKDILERAKIKPFCDDILSRIKDDIYAVG